MSPVAGPSGYRAALSGVAVAARPDRAFVRMVGKDPAGVLEGVFTGRVPGPPAAPEDGVVRGQGSYSAVLTPKGRMVTDLRMMRGPRPDDGLLLVVPTGALAGLLAHLGRFVPPRLARAVDETGHTVALTVAGPGAAALLSREALGLRVDEGELAALTEDAWVRMDEGESGVLVMRSGDLAAPAFEVMADSATAEALRARLTDAGAESLEDSDREALRVEAGRPAWGSELGEDTIPPEAGIAARAIDHDKGCYTGQEVIVRIRDRGHVNRHLRGFRLGSADAVPGTELWAPGRGTPVGRVTTTVWSPRAGEALGLGYVRREVEVPGTVRADGPEGAVVGVLALEAGEEDGWWKAPVPD